MIPKTFIAGDTFSGTLPEDVNHQSQDGYTALIYLTNASGVFQVSGTAVEGLNSGDDPSFLTSSYWQFTAQPIGSGAAFTQNWTPGDYGWQAVVQKIVGGAITEQYTLGTGQITIFAGYGQAGDSRSIVKQALDAINAALLNRATSAQSVIRIGDKEVRYHTIQELLALKQLYQAEYTREVQAAQIAAGTGGTSRLLVRF